MARGIEVTLDEALPATEGGDGLTHRGVEQLAHLALLARHLQAATSAPESRLDGDRQPVLTREVDDLVGGRDRVLGAGDQRSARLLCDVSGRDRFHELLDRFRRVTDSGQTRVYHGAREVGVLAQ